MTTNARRRLVTAALVATLLGTTSAAAQSLPRPRTGIWVAAAFGPAQPYEWAFVGSLGFRHTRVVARARYAITFESPGARVDDVGILLGVVVTPPSQRSQLAIGAGVGRVRQVYNCFLCSGPTFPTATGVLLDAEGRLALAPGVGLTAYAFGDLNSRLSFGGLALGLFIGRL